MDGTRRSKRRIGCAVVLLLTALTTGWLASVAWHEAKADPIVRRTTLTLPGMPSGTQPVTIALLSDIHVAEPDMPPARLARIVAQVNALHPDVIVLAGDFVSAHGAFIHPYPIATAIAPLAGLHAPLGVYAVDGNHDFWRGRRKVEAELARRGVTVLDNTARRVGPLALGGLSNIIRNPRRLEATLAAMRAVGGAPVMVSHSPDNFHWLPPNTGLMLAGHTHCGQIRLFGWAPVTNSRFGQRYACGIVRERGDELIVTAGLGTSVVPFRLGAPPDLWLIEIRPR
jgi:predicted MPP superfamily phosphohydrolase